MLGKLIFFLTCLHINFVLGQEDCTDVRGRSISHGLHFVPGPNTCNLCVCDHGEPKYCKAVLCSPPQDCRSFRVGNTCCEFICLDDVVKPAENVDASVSVVVASIAAVFFITVPVVAYRIKKYRRHRQPHTDDQRSLTSIGYISGSMAYVGGNCETGMSAWKPPGNYMPRGEAPPPYDEAVAQSRAEAMRMNNEAFHRTYAAGVDALARADEAMCVAHGYMNVSRAQQQVANPQNCYNAPLLQTVHPLDTRELPVPHPLAPNVGIGYPSAIRLTGSLGAISNRGLLSLLQREPEPERPHNVPGFYTSELHRTIPRLAGFPGAPDALSGLSRGERALGCEIRRSFHRPGEPRREAAHAHTGRSVPRNLNIASSDELSRARLHRDEPDGSAEHGAAGARGGGSGRGRIHSAEAGEASGTGAPCPPPPAVAPAPPDAPPQDIHTCATLPLTVDKPSCVCSYEGAVAPGGEEVDDYRSECENCKSASSSRWVLEEGWGEEQDGTQTLQRRAPPPAPPPPATATLPQPVTKQRPILGPPSNWENWFNTIPDSDSESEEE